MPAGGGLGQLDIDVGEVAHVREHPDLALAGLACDDWLELAVDRELHVALIVGQRRILGHVQCRAAGAGGEALQVAGDRLEQAAIVADREGSLVPDREVFLTRLRLAEIDRGKKRAVGPFGQLVAFGRLDGADILGPVHIVQLSEPARSIEHEIVLKQHVADWDAVLGHQRQVAVRPADGEHADEAGIDLRRGQRVKMAMIPISSLGHRFGNVVSIGIGHPRRNVQQDVVGISFWAGMDSVHMQVERR